MKYLELIFINICSRVVFKKSFNSLVEKSFINLHQLNRRDQTLSVEKTNYLRFLRREGDKVTSGSRVEVVLENPCHSVTSFFVWKSCGSSFLSD